MSSEVSKSQNYPASFEVLYVEKGSRIELFVRIVYGFILALVAYFWEIAVSLAIFIQWFHILILGKRNEKLWQFTLSFYRFYARALAYFSLLTDARPPITGKAIPLPAAADYEFCTECGGKVSVGAVYCKKCGKELH